jgi:hypothetical protein
MKLFCRSLLKGMTEKRLKLKMALGSPASFYSFYSIVWRGRWQIKQSRMERKKNWFAPADIEKRWQKPPEQRST